jgi:hypothetical protein
VVGLESLLDWLGGRWNGSDVGLRRMTPRQRALERAVGWLAFACLELNCADDFRKRQ